MVVGKCNVMFYIADYFLNAVLESDFRQFIDLFSVWTVNMETRGLLAQKNVLHFGVQISVSVCSQPEKIRGPELCEYEWMKDIFLPPLSFSWTSSIVTAFWHTGGLSLMSSTTILIFRGLSTSSPSLSFVITKNEYCNEGIEIRCVECLKWHICI